MPFRENKQERFLDTFREAGWTMIFDCNERNGNRAFWDFDRLHKQWEEAFEWCIDQFGEDHPGWKGIQPFKAFAFRDPVAATAFKLRWC